MYADDFVGQFRANRAIGRITQDANAAASRYLANPSEANRAYAQQLAELEAEFRQNNTAALDDEGAVAPLISKTAAGHLPQWGDQIKAKAGGAVIGGTLGTIAVPGVGTVKGAKAGAITASGIQAFRQIQGAAYRELRAMGVDEEAARAAAQDEALISALIEMGDTWFDITTMGKGTVLKGLLKSGIKNPKAAELLNLLGKYGLNIGRESLEEGLQQGVSIANRNRQGAGTFDLAGKTAGTVWDAVMGKNPAAWQEMWAAAKEGGKVAALFGGAEMAGHTMVASGLTTGTVGEHTVTKLRNRLIVEGEAQLRAGELSDTGHLEAMGEALLENGIMPSNEMLEVMEVSEPEARGIMSIMAMEEMDEASD